MRDMTDYEQRLTGEDMAFERYQEHYRRKIVKKMIDVYAKEGDSILEIGCGMNPLFTDYQDKYEFTVIEPAELFFKHMEVLAKSYQRAVCYQGFFEDIAGKIKEPAFDMIICAGLLQEVEDPKKLLRAIQSKCDEKTIVHVNVPNAFSMHRLLAKEMGSMEDVHQFSESNRLLQQHNVFDMESLKQLVSSENYEVVDSGSCFFKPFTQKQMQQCMEHGILNHDILDALDSVCGSYMKEYGSEIYLNMKIKR